MCNLLMKLCLIIVGFFSLTESAMMGGKMVKYRGELLWKYVLQDHEFLLNLIMSVSLKRLSKSSTKISKSSKKFLMQILCKKNLDFFQFPLNTKIFLKLLQQSEDLMEMGLSLNYVTKIWSEPLPFESSQ